MKKRILNLILCFILLFTCVLPIAYGCGGKDSGDNKLVIWSDAAPLHFNYEVGSQVGENYDPDCETSKFLIDMIQQKYPDLEISIESHGNSADLNTALRDAKVSNKMPDIVIGEQFIQSQIEKNYFIPLTIPKETKNAIPDFLWMQSQDENGTQYGYPAMTGCFSLIYNKAIFEEVYGAGWEQKIPTTTAEIFTVASEIKGYYRNTSRKDQISGFLLNATKGVSSAYRNGIVMSIFGGGIVNQNGEFIVNCQENKDAMEWLTTLIPYTSTGNISLTSETDINTELLSGNVAMAIEIAPVVSPFGGIDVSDFGVAPLPTHNGNRTTNILVGSTSYMITKECRNPDIAQDILEMMVSKEVQSKLYVTSTNRIPVRSDVLMEALTSTDSKVVEKNKVMMPYIESILFSNELVLGLPSFVTNFTNIWDTWTAAIQTIFTSPSQQTINTQLNNIQNLMISG